MENYKELIASTVEKNRQNILIICETCKYRYS